jgi:hypothetical protein
VTKGEHMKSQPNCEGHGQSIKSLGYARREQFIEITKVGRRNRPTALEEFRNMNETEESVHFSSPEMYSLKFHEKIGPFEKGPSGRSGISLASHYHWIRRTLAGGRLNDSW